MTPITRLRLLMWLLRGTCLTMVVVWLIGGWYAIYLRDRYEAMDAHWHRWKDRIHREERWEDERRVLHNIINGQSTIISEHRKTCPMSWHVDPEADRE